MLGLSRRFNAIGEGAPNADQLASASVRFRRYSQETGRWSVPADAVKTTKCVPLGCASGIELLPLCGWRFHSEWNLLDSITGVPDNV